MNNNEYLSLLFPMTKQDNFRVFFLICILNTLCKQKNPSEMTLSNAKNGLFFSLQMKVWRLHVIYSLRAIICGSQRIKRAFSVRIIKVLLLPKLRVIDSLDRCSFTFKIGEFVPFS